MSICINGHDYRLVGLDTNVVSEIVQGREDVRRGFFSLFAGDRHIPCFSIYSTFELRRRPEIYEQFLDLFDVLPCMVLKNEEQLFEDERTAYPGKVHIDPTLLPFSLLNRPKGTNLRNVMQMSFQDPGTLRREAEWPHLKKELLDGWIALRPNFRPKGSSINGLDGRDFVRRATVENVRERAREWIAELEAKGEVVSPAAFPSVRMTLWTVFFRLYVARQRRPETQDVFDVLISTPAPYLDVVITEKFQADIYAKVQQLDPDMPRFDVLTLRDLRKAASSASPAG